MTLEKIGKNMWGLNAFYYYRDLEKAWAFYRDIFGFETVADYGFAKMMKVANGSYLTLVDEASGMHSADEPKSVTLALVTEEVERWYHYLQWAGATLERQLNWEPGKAHDGFVVLDPEGYFIEVERFNPHPENPQILPLLAAIEPLGPDASNPNCQRPAPLRVQGSVLWLYHADLAAACRFYEALLGVELLIDQGWAKVYQIAGGGLLGLVDGTKGLHETAPQKCVTISFFTEQLEAWFDHVQTIDGFELRTPDITDESGKVNIFVGYDPEGYFLEWDQFLTVDDNHRLLETA